MSKKFSLLKIGVKVTLIVADQKPFHMIYIIRMIYIMKDLIKRGCRTLCLVKISSFTMEEWTYLIIS
jgi:hypothetical protein